LDLAGMQGGSVYGAVAYAATFGARTQPRSEAVGAGCRGAALPRAADASEVYAVAAINAATMVNLDIDFLHV
jgi:hypothetical protein